MEAHVGRVMLTRWAGRESKDDLVVDEKHGLVVARRTWAMDHTVAAFGAQHRLLPRNLPREYVPQVTALYRIFEDTMAGQKVARYVNIRPDDHYFDAETYDLLAKKVHGAPLATGVIEPETRRRR